MIHRFSLPDDAADERVVVSVAGLDVVLGAAHTDEDALATLERREATLVSDSGDYETEDAEVARLIASAYPDVAYEVEIDSEVYDASDENAIADANRALFEREAAAQAEAQVEAVAEAQPDFAEVPDVFDVTTEPDADSEEPTE